MSRCLPLALAGTTALLVATASGCGRTRATAGAAAAPEAEPESEANVSGTEGEPDDALATEAPASAAQAAGAGGSNAVIAEARRVLATMTASTYSHKTHVEGTTYDVDCSGFAIVLLARADPPALAELRAATVRRPLAKHFVSLLTSSSPEARWQRLGRVQDLAPGDIVAWNKPVEVTSTNTGHVMIVAATPQPHGEGAFALEIIDSSAAPHGKEDARKSAHSTGVGHGIIVLETDRGGAPLAYRWSTGHGSKRHATTIALGRVR